VPTLIQLQHPIRVRQQSIRQAVKVSLKEEGIRDRAVEVSILLVDDTTIEDLNTRYRGKHKPTDVLSFPQEQEIPIPGMPRLLGDIVISLDTAVKQAARAGHSIDDEVAQLAIHGLLHLLGYDDVTPEGYAEMVEKGARIWQRLHDGGA